MRRSLCLAILCLICLPGASASAQLFWGGLPTQCPLDAAPQSQQLAPLSSESLATLREWLTQESQATAKDLASGAIMPCGAPDPRDHASPGICLNAQGQLDQKEEVQRGGDTGLVVAKTTPRFVAASLTEDIAPLIPLQAPESSCVWDSEHPHRCEGTPLTPARLHLEATLGQVLGAAPLALRHPVPRALTLALIKATPHRLVGPARGHPDLLVPPPKASC